MAKIRVLLADDHAVLRAGLRALLNSQPDIEVVGEAADGDEALRAAERVRPDIVLMDITMPGTDGLEATRRLKHRQPQVRVIVLTMHEDEEFLRQVLAAGGSGYVLKKAAESELLSALRAVHRGEAFIYPSLTQVLIEGYLRQTEERGRKKELAEPAPDNLTAREVEVLRLIAQGYTNQQIADQLVISVKTVETHKAHIMDKLGLRSRVELVRYAVQRGLLRQ
jgi:two-component system response regulator NreC